MGGYNLDKVLILYSIGQAGKRIIFINKNLEEIISISKLNKIYIN